MTVYLRIKVSKYGVISGPYFPVFGLNTGNRIPSEYMKRRTRSKLVFGQFLLNDTSVII